MMAGFGPSNESLKARHDLFVKNVRPNDLSRRLNFRSFDRYGGREVSSSSALWTIANFFMPSAIVLAAGRVSKLKPRLSTNNAASMFPV